MTDLTGLVREDRVHGSVYTDPDIFAREMEIIFGRAWIYVGCEGEIPDPGDFRQRRIGAQPVILVRDDDGVVRVLMNRCTHRGNAICRLERGRAQAFTCPYHGWRFRLDGFLAAVPYIDRYPPEFDRTALGLRPAPRVDSYRGFVFASLSPSGITLREHLGAFAMAEMDDLVDAAPDSALDVRAGVHKAGYHGNWKLQVENSMDGYHANFTHRGYFDILQTRTGVDPKPNATSASPARIRDLGNGHSSWDVSGLVKAGARAGSADARQSEALQAYTEAMIGRHGRARTEQLLAKVTTHLVVFPNLAFIGSHIRLIQPVAVDETEVYLFPTLLKGAPPELNTGRLRQHEAFYGPAGGGAPDDLEIFARNQMGLGAHVDPWLLLARGLGREQIDDAGVSSGQMTDETPQRAMWRRWRDFMEGAPDVLPALVEARVAAE